MSLKGEEQSAHVPLANTTPVDLKGVPAPVRAAYTAPPTAWDAETAAEAGRRSGEVRRRKAQLSPEERVFNAIDKKSDKLVSELIDAALGDGDFAELKLETRVTALTRLLEWRIGKPKSAAPKESKEGPAVPESGDDLFT